jgi:hypothetical protein
MTFLARAAMTIQATSFSPSAPSTNAWVDVIRPERTPFKKTGSAVSASAPMPAQNSSRPLRVGTGNERRNTAVLPATTAVCSRKPTSGAPALSPRAGSAASSTNGGPTRTMGANGHSMRSASCTK